MTRKWYRKDGRNSGDAVWRVATEKQSGGLFRLRREKSHKGRPHSGKNVAHAGVIPDLGEDLIMGTDYGSFPELLDTLNQNKQTDSWCCVALQK
ncbi:hypothetical protein NDU88_005803 [Pleurodeles waltl]|uniref:Uncharacterized protein n=1 Tax=Pleurodeles waltl TaxID=8319 RepID=A0AAV7PGG4_PLEWA|nr:hypothetical protein NDU88_005803 [Pleurodeles waltl]